MIFRGPRPSSPTMEKIENFIVILIVWYCIPALWIAMQVYKLVSWLEVRDEKRKKG